MKVAWPTPRTCEIDPTNAKGTGAAVICAEHFVARNGYTMAEPITEKGELAPESIEWGSIPEIPKGRRGTLEAKAHGICEGRPSGRGYTVVFRRPYGTESARAVTMTEAFDEIRVEHKDFSLAFGRQNDRCKLLTSGR